MQPSKFAPGLASALQDPYGTLSALSEFAPDLGYLGFADREDAAVPIVVRCDEGAQLAGVPGTTVHGQTGRIRSAFASPEGLAALSDEASVERIELAELLYPLCDQAAQKTGLCQLKTRDPQLTGRGVLVGVVDTGIDAQHGWFSGRLQAVWDQTMQGGGWPGAQYGMVLSGSGMAASADMNGHGTHVAGIAVGSHPVYGGVAPAADLVVVKTNFLSTGIIDAINYIFAEADNRQLPAVINLSLGGHLDPHDGSDVLSELIDSRSGAGRIVVAAAGNDNEEDIHAEVVVRPGGVECLEIQVVGSSQPNSPRRVVLNGWYGDSIALEVAVRTSSGITTPYQTVAPNASNFVEYVLGRTRVRLETPPPLVTNSSHQILVTLEAAAVGGAIQGGTWALLLRNPSATCAVAVDFWSVVPRGSRQATFLRAHSSNRTKIGAPGCASHAITVGAYTTRNGWADQGGGLQAAGLPLDMPSTFSSPGPRRDGALKPDVSAPGAVIISARSQHARPRASDVIANDAMVNAGSSMAAPYISGLVALLLQRNGALDPDDVKRILRANSTLPNGAPGAHDLRCGFGLINASGL